MIRTGRRGCGLHHLSQLVDALHSTFEAQQLSHLRDTVTGCRCTEERSPSHKRPNPLSGSRKSQRIWKTSIIGSPPCFLRHGQPEGSSKCRLDSRLTSESSPCFLGFWQARDKHAHWLKRTHNVWSVVITCHNPM